ncbi:MAG: acyl-CoA dehydrogenase [Firmicutes bacterium]|nr:acyl-CoA dehydrogenase [Bacillota bacterium]
MMFQLTEVQKDIRKLACDFAQKEVKPGAKERDEKEMFDAELIEKIHKTLGFAGICFPEAYGGAGLDTLSYILAVEELAKVDAGVSIALSAHVSLGAWPIEKFGTPEQKEKFLRPLALGEKLAAFGLTEADAGTDAAAQRTIAVADGDEYILNGSKMWITNAGAADIYVIFAMTDKAKGLKGISAFIVEKGTPGFSFGNEEHKMGIHSSMTRELIFQNVRIPKSNLLGSEGQGFKIAMMTLDGGRIGVAAQALGIAEAALDYAVNYAKKRQQFGKPIATFQAIQFMLADMATKVEAARLLVYKAASYKDQGLPYSTEAAMAKLYASDAAMQVTTDAVQVYGGYGFSREYPVEQLMRDAKITQIYEGTNQVQRMVIGGALLK